MTLNILHIDMDAFFASVEQKDNPELKGKPVIIGGTALGNRGVVSTASYEARKYGVHSAMPIKKAKKLCPHGIYLPGRMERYQEISNKVFDIISNFTPLIEKISIDEAFLDLKGSHLLFGSSVEIGKKLQKQIKKELNLNASIGIAPNKFLAKLASDLEKPEGFKIIPGDKIDDVLTPLAVDEIWGVGEETEKILRKKGIKTIGQLRNLSQRELKSMFGKFGKKLYKLARGIDNRSVQTESETKSISHETTFKNDLKDEEKIFSILMKLSEKTGRRLRKNQFKGTTVFIKIRYNNFDTYTRQTTTQRSFSDTETIYKKGKKLIKENNLLIKPVRLLGIGITNLIGENKEQLSLFDKNEDKIVKVVDNIKDKYGENSIFRAKQLIYKKDKDENKKND